MGGKKDKERLKQLKTAGQKENHGPFNQQENAKENKSRVTPGVKTVGKKNMGDEKDNER